METIKKRAISYENFRKEKQPQINQIKRKMKKTFWYGSCLQEPVKDSYIFYDSMQGELLKGQIQNVFIENLKNTNKIQIVGIKKQLLPNIQQQLENSKWRDRVHLVIRGTEEYYYWLAIAKYLVSDSYFTHNFYKRPEQFFYYLGTKNDDSYLYRHYLQADKIYNNECKVITSNKKSWVFYCNFSNTTVENAMDLLNYLDSLNSKDYDLTLITPSMSQVDSIVKNSISPSIDFFNFKERVPCTPEEYLQHEYLTRYLLNADHVVDTVNTKHPYMKMYQRNLKRLWGNKNFDQAFYYGKLTNSDYLYFSQIPAGKKSYIRYEAHQDEQSFYMKSETRRYFFSQRCEIYQNFDKIYCTGKQLLQINKEADPKIYEHARYFPRISARYEYLKKTMQETIYQGKPYLVLELSSGKYPHVKLLPKPDKHKQNILYRLQDSSKEKLHDCLQQLQENKNMILYLIDDENTIQSREFEIISRLGVEQQVIILKRPVLIKEYLKQFDSVI